MTAHNMLKIAHIINAEKTQYPENNSNYAEESHNMQIISHNIHVQCRYVLTHPTIELGTKWVQLTEIYAIHSYQGYL